MVLWRDRLPPLFSRLRPLPWSGELPLSRITWGQAFSRAALSDAKVSLEVPEMGVSSRSNRGELKHIRLIIYRETPLILPKEARPKPTLWYSKLYRHVKVIIGKINYRQWDDATCTKSQ